MNLSNETIGFLGGIFVFGSVIPYMISTIRGTIEPNIISWVLWTMIGFLMLVTYKGAASHDNMWPVIFGFTNPAIILLLIIIQWKRLDKSFEVSTTDMISATFGIICLGLWMALKHDKMLMQYALFGAIIADAFAALPTMMSSLKEPQREKPFAWGMFGVGYGLSIFSVDEYSVSNLALPVWMIIGSSIITIPLIVHRIKNRIPVRKWIC